MTLNQFSLCGIVPPQTSPMPSLMLVASHVAASTLLAAKPLGLRCERNHTQPLSLSFVPAQGSRIAPEGLVA